MHVHVVPGNGHLEVMHTVPVPPISSLQINLGLLGEWAAIIALVLFVIQWTVYDRRAWHNPVGRTLLLKDILLAVVIGSLLFLHYVLITSLALENFFRWFQIACVGLIGPVVLWRCWVFRRLHLETHEPDLLARCGTWLRARRRGRTGR